MNSLNSAQQGEFKTIITPICQQIISDLKTMNPVERIVKQLFMEIFGDNFRIKTTMRDNGTHFYTSIDYEFFKDYVNKLNDKVKLNSGNYSDDYKKALGELAKLSINEIKHIRKLQSELETLQLSNNHDNKTIERKEKLKIELNNFSYTNKEADYELINGYKVKFNKEAIVSANSFPEKPRCQGIIEIAGSKVEFDFPDKQRFVYMIRNSIKKYTNENYFLSILVGVYKKNIHTIVAITIKENKIKLSEILHFDGKLNENKDLEQPKIGRIDSTYSEIDLINEQEKTNKRTESDYDFDYEIALSSRENSKTVKVNRIDDNKNAKSIYIFEFTIIGKEAKLAKIYCE